MTINNVLGILAGTVLVFSPIAFGIYAIRAIDATKKEIKDAKEAIEKAREALEKARKNENI